MTRVLILLVVVICSVTSINRVVIVFVGFILKSCDCNLSKPWIQFYKSSARLWERSFLDRDLLQVSIDLVFLVNGESNRNGKLSLSLSVVSELIFPRIWYRYEYKDDGNKIASFGEEHDGA